MNITRWIMVVGAGVLVLVWLEVRKPSNEPAPLAQESAFFDAAGSGDVATVEGMLNGGVDVNIKDASFGHTALIIASRRGHLPVVELLLAKGADVNVTDNYGNTALRWALKTNRGESQAIVQRLRQAGAVEPGQAAHVAQGLVRLVGSVADTPVPGRGPTVRHTGGV